MGGQRDDGQIGRWRMNGCTDVGEWRGDGSLKPWDRHVVDRVEDELMWDG